MSKYDFLVVGAGLFGATFACNANRTGKKVLVIDRRNHLAGTVYTEKCICLLKRQNECRIDDDRLFKILL